MAVARDLKLKIPAELQVQLKLRVSAPELGFEPTKELLRRGTEFTALVGYNDISAIGAVRALMNSGLRVPQDVSVVGFDDIRAAAYLNPSLTTIRQPLHQMGVTAARILLQRIRGLEEYPDSMAIAPELVIRESTGPCPAVPPRPKK
jgi:LacI family transcriptional regulator